MKLDTRKRHPQPAKYLQGIASAKYKIEEGNEQVLWMTMVLPTFPERKVGKTEG
ncbi:MULTISPECIES: hypothetical protein [Acinetobacter]|uniref:Uncharacterized protein n=1 Tax=Acinetobacter colistiniresistens TaxID=280145 RepID=S3TM04_9GAMM|nr:MULTISPECIES: hypothetical protein [Acinetobacter]EPG42711.1 hypothetical protein F907_00135 [Acinetobacter colistiniresistens]